jgi:hypothetical protein
MMQNSGPAGSSSRGLDRSWKTFSSKGAEKRREHGSKGSYVFRDSNDDSRVWVVFDWDQESFGPDGTTTLAGLREP